MEATQSGGWGGMGELLALSPRCGVHQALLQEVLMGRRILGTGALLGVSVEGWGGRSWAQPAWPCLAPAQAAGPALPPPPAPEASRGNAA